jgi:ketosteroid isomerase-like protein
MHPVATRLVISLAALVTATGCQRPGAAPAASAPAFDLAAARKTIEEKNARFTQAHVTGDSAAMVDIFTDDARVLAPNADPVIGRAAIEVLTSEYLKFGITEFTEETTTLYGNAEMLIDEGTYVMVYGKPAIVDKGKYLNVWRMVNGEWKLYSNMWNASAPAPPPT